MAAALTSAAELKPAGQRSTGVGAQPVRAMNALPLYSNQPLMLSRARLAKASRPR